MKTVFRQILLILITLCILVGCDTEVTPPTPPAPPAKNEVFSLGNKTFETLEETLAQVPSKGSKAAGDYVITLLKESSGPGLSVSAKDFTLDLNGLNYTFTSSLVVDGSSNVVITGNTGSSVNMGGNALKASGGSDLKILQHAVVNGTVESASASTVKLGENATLTGAVIADNGGFTVSGSSKIDADVTASNGSELAFETEGNVIRNLSKTTSDTVVFTRDITVNALAEGSDNKVITAYNTQISGGATLERDTEYLVLLELKPYKAIAAALSDAKNGNTLVLLNNVDNSGSTIYIEKEIVLDLQTYNISSGTMNSSRNITILGSGEITSDMTVSGGARFALNGGTFKENPSSNTDKYSVPLDCKVTENGGKYIVSAVTENEAAARIGEKYYLTLQNAIEDSGNAAEITLLKNTQEYSIVVSQGRNITLNLNADLGSATSLAAFVNNANISFRGTGSVYLSSMALTNGSVTDICIEGIINCILPEPAEGVTLRITGGTFTSDPSAYVPAGYKATEVTGSYTVTEVTEEEAAAMVGGILYESFEKAWSAALGNEEYSIVLMNNVNLASAYTLDINNTLSLDLNGKNITPTDTAFLVKKGSLRLEGSGTVGNITVGDNTAGLQPSVIVGSAVSAGAVVINTNNTDRRTAIINGRAASVTSTGSASVIQLGENSHVDGNISASGILGISGGAYSGTIGAASVDIEGGTFTGVVFTAPEVSVSGGTFEQTLTAGNGSVVSVSGGTFNCTLAVQEGGRLVITGGTFSSDPSDYLAPGYKAVQDPSAGTWTVSTEDLENMVARVGQAYYQSLPTAVEAATSGQTVTLLKDVNIEAITINKNMTLVLNANLTAASGTAFNVTAGTLTLTGSGKLNGNLQISGGNVNITGGSYSFDPAAHVDASYFSISQDGVWYTVTPKENPAVRMNGTNYYSLSQALSAASGGDTLTLLKDLTESDVTVSKDVTMDLSAYNLTGSVTVNDSADVALTGLGSITGNVTNTGSGTLSITGISITGSVTNSSTGKTGLSACAITGTEVAVSATAGSIEIAGGIFEAATVLRTDGGSITVSGGSFTGTLTKNTGSLVIKGGTFNNDPRDYLAEGYKAVLNAGIWTVSTDSTSSEYVARTGSKYYETLEVAVSEVEDSQTIVLISDIALTQALNMAREKTYSVNLNGHTLSSDGTVALNITAGNVTLTGSGIISSAITVTANAGLTIDSSVYITCANSNAVTLSGSAFLTVSGAIIEATGGEAKAIETSGSSTFTVASAIVRGPVNNLSNVASSISGGQFFNTVTNSGTLNVSGGTFSAAVTNSGTLNISGGLFFSSLTGGTTLSVTGGTFYESVSGPDNSISGGTFYTCPGSSLIATDKIAVESGNVWVIVNNIASAVALVTGNSNTGYYSALDQAFANAAGGKLLLLENATLSSETVVSGAVNLDLGGHTMTTGNKLTVSPAGSLAIINSVPSSGSLSGTVSVEYGGTVRAYGTIHAWDADALRLLVSCIQNNGEVVLDQNISLSEDLTVDRPIIILLNGKTLTGNVAITSNAILSGGASTSTVTGNVEYSGTEFASLEKVTVSASITNSADGILFVSDSTASTVSNTSTGIIAVSGTSGSAGLNVSDGTVYIEGGTYTATEVSGGRLSISDGTFNNTVNATGGSVEIDGGTFTGALSKGENAVISITGGTFSADPSAFVVPGYGATLDTSTNKWTVSEIGSMQATAGIGTTYFNSLSAALNAASNGDRIILYKDDTYSALTIYKSVTLELNAILTSNLSVESGVSAVISGTGSLVGIVTKDGSASVSITGGTYTFNPASYVDPDRYVIVKNTGTSSTWTVSALQPGNAAASVGGFYYSSLQKAVDAANYNQTVNLLKEVTEDISVSKTITINLTEPAILTGNITCTSGTLTLTGTGKLSGDIVRQGDAVVLIRGGKYSQDPASYLAKGYKAVQADNWYVVSVDVSSNVCSVDGNYYSSVKDAVASTPYFLTTTINLLQSSSEESVVIPSGKNIVLNLGSDSERALTAAITVNGGLSIRGTGRVDGTIAKGQSGSLAIYGGTYSFNPASFVDNTRYVVVPGAGSSWTVSEATAVNAAASVGVDSDLTFYTSLAAAVENASARHTVTLLRDVEEDVIITSSIHKLTLGAFTVTGNLSVTGGSVSVEASSESGGITGSLTNSGNGTVSTQGLKIGGSTINNNRGSISLKNGTAGSIENTDSGSIAIDGTLITGNIRNSSYGSVTIDNATVSGSVLNGNGITNIAGGTFSSTAAVLTATSGRITVSGGTFTGNLAATANTLNICGGYFSADPTAYVDTGYFQVTGSVEDMYYVSVKEGSMVARIDSAYYKTLDEAINAVPGGNISTTVTIINNVGSDSSALQIPSNKTVILDLGAWTVDRSIVCSGNLSIRGTGSVTGTITREGLSTASVSITGGTYSFNPSDSTYGYVDTDRYKVTANSTSPATWTVSLIPASDAVASRVSSAETEYFSSLSAAVYASENNNTVNLLKNDSVAGGKLNVVSQTVLNLTSGTTLTGSVRSAAASVTLEGSGTLTGSVEYLGSTGTMSISGITVNGQVSNASTGTVNISGGTFSVSSGNVVEALAGTVNISGGTFTGSLNGTDSSSVKHIVITDGTFSTDPTAYLHEGYTTTQSGGLWTVVSAN